MRAWPPAAAREGVELSTAAVLAILAGVFLAELLIFAAVSGRALPTISPFGSATDAAMGQLVVPSAIIAVISVGIVLMLGWSRAAGLTLGSWSMWGVVPLAIMAVAAVVTVQIPRVGAAGGAVLGLVFGGLFFAAFAEEVVFRGFLLHGLTRRVGGRWAVRIGSSLFAAAHIPALISQDLVQGGIPVALLVLFGFAVFLCRIRAATGSIWFASGVHALWNFVTVGVVGLAFSVDDVPAAFVAIKLVPVVIGLVIAVRLARHHDVGDVAPMPVGGSLGRFQPLPPPVPDPSVVWMPAVPAVPPPRPDLP